jgi:hypothetical protein
MLVENEIQRSYRISSSNSGTEKDETIRATMEYRRSKKYVAIKDNFNE